MKYSDGDSPRVAGDGRQSEAWLADLFLSLREGDDVYVNGRDRPFTVTGRSWDARESGYWRYTLEGYGTEYEGIVAPGDEYTAKAVGPFRTEAGTVLHVREASRDADGEEFAVSDTRADEWLAEAGIDVR